MHHEADSAQVLAVVIKEGPAAGTVIERPAKRVLDETRAVPLGPDLPQLLDADAVFLRFAPSAQIVVLDELLGERAVRALGDERVLAAQLHAAGERVLRFPVPANAHVTCGNADHGSVF